MLQVKATYTNETAGYHIGEDDWCEPFTEDHGRLFRFLQREYGRCTGRVYRQAPRSNLAAGFGAVGSAAVGWHFERQYPRSADGSSGTYTVGTWVELRTVPDGHE